MLYLLRQLIFILIFRLLMVNLAQAEPPAREQYTQPDPAMVSAVMKKAKEEAGNITLPVNKYNTQGLKAAQQSADFFHSQEFQERLQCEQKRLEKEVFGQYIVPWKKKRRKAKENRTIPAGSERIFLFISSSVPDETVHAYIATVARITEPSVILVMRGVVGGLTGRKGIQYFSRILKKDLRCRDEKTKDSRRRCPRYQVPVAIAADLFGQYGISRVPAVVYRDAKSSFRIQGDMALGYLLERINREAQSATLEKLIRKIRGHR